MTRRLRRRRDKTMCSVRCAVRHFRVRARTLQTCAEGRARCYPHTHSLLFFGIIARDDILFVVFCVCVCAIGPARMRTRCDAIRHARVRRRRARSLAARNIDTCNMNERRRDLGETWRRRRYAHAAICHRDVTGATRWRIGGWMCVCVCGG